MRIFFAKKITQTHPQIFINEKKKNLLARKSGATVYTTIVLHFETTQNSSREEGRGNTCKFRIHQSSVHFSQCPEGYVALSYFLCHRHYHYSLVNNASMCKKGMACLEYKHCQFSPRRGKFSFFCQSHMDAHTHGTTNSAHCN